MRNSRRRIRGGQRGRPEEAQVGLAQVVEGPPSWNHHRVGVSSAEHPPAVAVARHQHVEPEHEVLGTHSVGHGSRLRATWSLTQPVHLPNTSAVSAAHCVDPYDALMTEPRGRRAVTDRVIRRLTGGGSAVVSGELGIGKTELVRQVVAALRADGTTVTTLRASAGTRNIAFGALSGFIDPAARVDPAVQIAAATARLRSNAGGRPLVVAVDDAQFLDDATIAVLGALVAGSADTPPGLIDVAVVATVRSSDPAPAVLDDLWRQADADRITLGPLDAPDVTALVEEFFRQRDDRPVERSVVSAIVDRASGNPLFARELVTAHVHGDPAGLSMQLLEVVDRRLRSLGEAEQRHLAMIAVGQPLDVSSPLLDARVLAALEDAGLIVTRHTDGHARSVVAHLAHPLYGEVIVHRLTPLRRQEIARSLANTLVAPADGPTGDPSRQRRGDALRVVTWMLDAGDTPPADLAEAAAFEAIGWLDTDRADWLARLAVEAGRTASSLFTLGEVRRVSGQPDDAVELWNEAFELATDDDDIRRIALALGQLNNLFLQRPDLTIEVLTTARDRIEDPALRLGIEADLAVEASDHDRAEQIRGNERVLSDPACGDESAWTALSNILWLKATSLEVEGIDRYLARAEEIEQRLPAERDAEIDLIRAISINAPMIRGHLEEASAVARRWQEEAGRRGIAIGLSEFSAAVLELLRGRGDVAERLIGRAIDTLLAYDTFHTLPMVASAGSVVATANGDIQLAVRRTELANARVGAFAPWFDLWSARANGWIAAAAGDHDEAIRRVLEAAKLGQESGDLGWAAFALHDAASWGHDDDALRTARRGRESDCRLFDVIFDHLDAAAVRDPGGLAHCARRFEAMGALVPAGAAWANRAAHAADEVERCRDATRALTLAPAVALRPGTDDLALTSRQLDVARLAARGRPSKAIAIELFLSARTVDNHLREVYRRLGIGGRAELGEVIAG